MSRATRALLVAAVAAASLVVLLPSGASTAGKKVPSQLTYKAMIHVAGGVTQTHTVDRLGDCRPGIKYTVVEKADVEVRGTILVETYRQRQIRSTSATKPGGAEHVGALADVEESNWCPPDEPEEIERPQCLTRKGRGSVGLVPDGRGKAPWRVSVGISRLGGGSQRSDCLWSLGRQETPKGAVVSTLDGPYSDLVLPLDLRIRSFRTLGVGKRLIRTVRIGGSCSAPVIYRGREIPNAPGSGEDGECQIEGVFNVTIKRLNRISKQGVPLN